MNATKLRGFVKWMGFKDGPNTIYMAIIVALFLRSDKLEKEILHKLVETQEDYGKRIAALEKDFLERKIYKEVMHIRKTESK